MTKAEYISHLRALYLAANSSDSDEKPEWMHGDEAAAHCRLYDQIARDMDLPADWQFSA